MDSTAMVSKTNEDLPEPDTPVKTTSFPFGILRLTCFKLFSWALTMTILSLIYILPQEAAIREHQYLEQLPCADVRLPLFTIINYTGLGVYRQSIVLMVQRLCVIMIGHSIFNEGLAKMKLTQQQISSLKGRGFLLNRGTNCFSGRILSAGAVFSADDLNVIADIARKYGNGKVVFTSRLSAEIIGIPFECVEEAEKMAAEKGLCFGGTGAKIRPITACKGTTCVYGNFDTQALAEKLFQNYYLGWEQVKLPNKFKIGVGGCPNSCMKPSLNDFGIEGHRFPVYNSEYCKGCSICAVERHCPSKVVEKTSDGKIAIDKNNCLTCGVCTGKCPFNAFAKEVPVQYKIFVGGTWGRKTRNGTPLSRMVSYEEIFRILEKTILWYKENAYLKERLGAAIDRIGIEHFEKEIWDDDLLMRKDEILQAEIKKL